MTEIPILYSFRRCPYAMRARLGLFAGNIRFEWREILLRDKPDAFLAVSTDNTVPVLDCGTHVIQESLDILKLGFAGEGFDDALIDWCDTAFKPLLDTYKYKDDFEARDTAARMLSEHAHAITQANAQTRSAILPFIRQFAHVDMAWFDNQKWPELAQCLTEFKESAIFAQIMIKHEPWQKGNAPLIYGQKSL